MHEGEELASLLKSALNEKISASAVAACHSTSLLFRNRVVIKERSNPSQNIVVAFHFSNQPVLQT